MQGNFGVDKNLEFWECQMYAEGLCHTGGHMFPTRQVLPSLASLIIFYACKGHSIGDHLTYFATRKDKFRYWTFSDYLVPNANVAQDKFLS